jgi:hypothetical protein
VSINLGLFDIEDQLLEQLRQHVTAVEVYDGDPAGSRALTGGLWPHESTDDIDWRGLGGQPWNRAEDVRIELRAATYREANAQQSARRLAVDALRVAIAEVAAAIATDQSLGMTCTDARLGRVKARAIPSTKGWEAQADLTVICQHIPTPGSTP